MTDTVKLYGSLGRYFDSMNFRTATMYDGDAARYIESHCVSRHWNTAGRAWFVHMPRDWFKEYVKEAQDE